MREDVSKDLSSLDGARSVDTTGMSPDYKLYIDDQIARSVRRSTYLNPIRAMIGSRDQLIRQVSRVVKSWSISCGEILSIGCRDERELDTINTYLRSARVTGLDLFSATPRIMAADMHDLPFHNEKFDVSLAIHCMEHSYDASKSLSEMLRVTKNDGLLGIETPIGFEVTQFDRNDFVGVAEIVSRFPPESVTVLWAEVECRAELAKPPTLRVILQKNEVNRS